MSGTLSHLVLSLYSTATSHSGSHLTHIVANALGDKARSVTLNGREYLVAEMTILVPGVLRGSRGALLYPVDETSRNVGHWNKQPITLGHPTYNGEPISVNDKRFDRKYILGYLQNDRWDKAKQRRRVEGWFDVRNTAAVAPQLVQRLRDGTPTELSTGLLTDNHPAPPGANYLGKPYYAVARNYTPDHLAVLLDRPGACSLNDGCGVLVNQEPVVQPTLFDSLPPVSVLAPCAMDGTPTPSAPTPTPTTNCACQTTPAPVAATVVNEMACPKCGKMLADNATKCESCGWEKEPDTADYPAATATANADAPLAPAPIPQPEPTPAPVVITTNAEPSPVVELPPVPDPTPTPPSEPLRTPDGRYATEQQALMAEMVRRVFGGMPPPPPLANLIRAPEVPLGMTVANWLTAGQPQQPGFLLGRTITQTFAPNVV